MLWIGLAFVAGFAAGAGALWWYRDREDLEIVAELECDPYQR